MVVEGGVVFPTVPLSIELSWSVLFPSPRHVIPKELLFVAVRAHFHLWGKDNLAIHSNWKWSFVLCEWSSCEKRPTDLSQERSARALVFPVRVWMSVLPNTPGLFSVSFLRSVRKVRPWIFFVSREATLFYHKLCSSFPFSKFSGSAYKLGNYFSWKWLHPVSFYSC